MYRHIFTKKMGRYWEVDAVALLSENYLKTIEYCGRLCYSSNDKITNDSYEKFIGGIVKSGHLSVIEHDTFDVILDVSESKADSLLHAITYIHEHAKLLTVVHDEVDGHLVIAGNIHMYYDLFNNCMAKIKKPSIILRIYKVYVAMIDKIFTHKLGGITSYRQTEVVDRLIELPSNIPGLKLRILNIDTIDTSFLNPSINITHGRMLSTINKYKELLCSVTYEIEDMPRIISQMDSRHRMQAMSQQSQRYVNESDFKYYTPECINAQKEYTIIVDGEPLTITYDKYMQIVRGIYNAFSDDGIKKEEARMVLTNATCTKYAITKQISDLQHYLYERTSPRAQLEVRDVAIEIKKYISENYDFKLEKEGVDNDNS